MAYTGSVKSFNPEKGWGHIECEETFAHFGKDIFLLRSALLGGLLAVQKNQTVTFNIEDKGRGPEATDVTVVSAIPGVNMGMHAVQQPMIPLHHGPGVDNGQGPTYTGVIKSFNPTSGWGHITCEQTEQMYGKDIFFMKSAVPGGTIQKGTPVTFEVTQGNKGPEARNVMPFAAAQQQQVQHGMYGGVAAGPPPRMHHQAAQQPQGNVNAGAVYFGTIKSFREDKGWGHISCPQTQALYGKDMFVMRSALNGAIVKEGDSVQFTVNQGVKGPEAANVRAMGAVDADQIYYGTIKMYIAEKGYGFIQCADTHSLFQKDIFLHKKELAGNAPTKGETVQFQVTISPEGRPEAIGVVLGATGAFIPRGDDEGYGQAIRPPRIIPRAGPYV